MMKSDRARAARLAMTVLLGATLLGGCAGDDSPEESLVTSAEDVVAEEDVDQLSGPDCLTGTWKMRNETFEAALAEMLRNDPALPPQMRGNFSLELSGASYIRFDGAGLYTAWLDDFTMTMSMSEGRVQHVQNSGDAASYEANDEYAWVTDFIGVYFNAEMVIDGIGSVSLNGPGEAKVNVFGFTADVPGVDRELIDGAARYECTPESLELHADGGLSAGFTRASSSVLQPTA